MTDTDIREPELEAIETGEEGHAAAWGGGSLVAIILIVLLLVLIF
jgi:hypothetical protein